MIEGLYATDLAYLQDLYNRVNALDDGRGPARSAAASRRVRLRSARAGGARGEWSATPSIN